MFSQAIEKTPVRGLLLSFAERFPFPVQGDAAWSALPPQHREALRAWGAEACGASYPPLPATAFMAFVRTGDRQVYEIPYFKRRRILIGAALAACMAPTPQLLDTVADGIWCICEESFWGVSAHNGSDHPGQLPASARPLPDRSNPYIDLFAAQTGCTLALVSRLLGRELDSIAPLLRRRIRTEIEERIFRPFMTHDDFWWMGMIRSDVNNWTPWIVSSVLHAAQALITDDADLALLVERALRMLDRYVATLPEDGGCDEGTGYWNMAGGSLLDCLEVVSQVTGGRMTFRQEPKLRAIGAFPLHAHIAGPWYWNFADCDARPMLDGERVYRFGEVTGNAALMQLGASVASGVLPRDTPQMDRVLNALFHTPPVSPSPPSEKHVSLPCLQVFARERNGLYAAIKGGNNNECHNHNDVGTFLLYADGEPVFIDVGNMVYTAKTFSAERYTLWNTQARNHNLPMIGEIDQQAGAAYRARDVAESADAVDMDIAPAYPEDAGVLRLHRRFAFAPTFTLTDTVELSSPAAVTWVFMTREMPVLGEGSLRVGKVRMTCDGEFTAISAHPIEVTDARMANNFPGTIYRLTLTAPDAKTLCRSFTFTKEEAP